jgi:hypothetical protein
LKSQDILQEETIYSLDRQLADSQKSFSALLWQKAMVFRSKVQSERGSLQKLHTEKLGMQDQLITASQVGKKVEKTWSTNKNLLRRRRYSYALSVFLHCCSQFVFQI